MRFGRRPLLGFVALTIAGCSGAAQISNAAGRGADLPAAPSYADDKAWAAWPGRPSDAAAVPADSGLLDRQAEARADVFFVHPTTFLSTRVGNADYDATGIAKAALERTVLRFEAGAFNGCCRIFVPRYRQASVGTFFSSGTDSLAPIELAYSDMRRAFDYYLAHENRGRPFIIASHSQGSLHTMRLLQEAVVGTPLQARMVAAYVIGYSIPNEIERTGLPICDGARQTGCLIHWASVRRGETDHPPGAWIWLDGHYQAIGNRKLVCVNPLSWRRDGAAPAAANLGALPRTPPAQAMPRALPGLGDAACEAGLLGVTLPPSARASFSDVLTWFGSYHDFDYHLFYLNVRQNAIERVAAFLARRPGE